MYSSFYLVYILIQHLYSTLLGLFDKSGESPFFCITGGFFPMSVVETIEPIIEKKLASMGYELFDIKFIRAGSRSILRLFIDKKGGITIDDCEQVSHDISMVLDVEDFSKAPYTLEVSSPGIDRPLTTEKDFIWAVGNTVRFRIKEAAGKNRTLKGKLLACTDGKCTLETDKGTSSIALSNIYSGKIEVTFK